MEMAHNVLTFSPKAPLKMANYSFAVNAQTPCSTEIVGIKNN